MTKSGIENKGISAKKRAVDTIEWGTFENIWEVNF